MKYLPVFMCGHPRVPDNFVKKGGNYGKNGRKQNYRCKTCHELKLAKLPTPGKIVFHCGHPYIDENKMPNGNRNGRAEVRCRTCNIEKQGYRAHNRTPLAVPAAVAQGHEYLDTQKVIRVNKAPTITKRMRKKFDLHFLWSKPGIQKSVDTAE